MEQKQQSEEKKLIQEHSTSPFSSMNTNTISCKEAWAVIQESFKFLWSACLTFEASFNLKEDARVYF